MNAKINTWLIYLNDSIEPSWIGAAWVVHKSECSDELLPHFAANTHAPGKNFYTAWSNQLWYAHHIGKFCFAGRFLPLLLCLFSLRFQHFLIFGLLFRRREFRM